MTFRTYLPWVAGLLVAVTAALGLAATLTPNRSTPNLPVAPVPRPEARPLLGPNKLLLVGDDYLVLADPNGKNDKKFNHKRELHRPIEVRLSPDGKMLAMLIVTSRPKNLRPNELPPGTLHIRGLDEKEPGTNLGIECDSFAWSADGTEIVYTGPGELKPGEKERPTVHGIVNVKTKAKTPLKIPAEHTILDWSQDGKYFLTQRANDEDWSTTLYLIKRDGTGSKPLTEPKEEGLVGRISPDGKHVLYTSRPNEVVITLGDSTLWLLDLATSNRAKVSNLPPEAMLTGFCWSPDGKRIAYSWTEAEQMNDEGGWLGWWYVTRTGKTR